MNARQAKQTVKEWVEANTQNWPGIRGAHLVGGITTMPDEAQFPAYKDVDLHLIFEEGSPALQPTDPYMNILEIPYKGLMLEGGLKSLREYQSVEAVLSNPEIAHHFTVDSLLYDPSGLLRNLQEQVKHEFPRRQWVLARREHERNGLKKMLALISLAHPGPFLARTYEMGKYLGIRHQGQLIAIAGERMWLDGYREISTVCAHPDFQGRGYARQLVNCLANIILSEGNTPFLHVMHDNERAISIYESLGFVERRRLPLIVIQLAAGVSDG